MGRKIRLTERDLHNIIRRSVNRIINETINPFEGFKHTYSMAPQEQESENRVFDALANKGFSVHEENEGDALVDAMVFLSPSGDKWEITRVYGTTEYEIHRPWDRFWVSLDEENLLRLLS